MVAAAGVAYLGAFTNSFRQTLCRQWREQLRDVGIPHTSECTLTSVLGVPAVLEGWQLQGLPGDNMSLENGMRF